MHQALVTPILKKRCLGHNHSKNHQSVSNLCLIAKILKRLVLSQDSSYLNHSNNHRSVSNLCLIDKILQRLVLSQVSSYLNSHNLYSTFQSAYCPGHSTETALLTVVDDLFLSLNNGKMSVLALLDFSSAFDTIDHPIIVQCPNFDFGFTDSVLKWFSSYLTDRTHYVSI